MPERVGFRLQQGRLGGHLDRFGLRADLQRNVHSQAAFDLHHDRIAHKLFEAALFPLQLVVAAGQDIHERKVTGPVRFYAVLFRVILIRQCDGSVDNGSAAAIRYGASNSSVHVLAVSGRRRERQNQKNG